MTIITTRQAAFLLGICCQRVRALLSQNRIKGAYKHNGFWRIPVYGKMPVVIPGTRGPKGVWCHHLRKKPTIIHVNQQKIKSNGKRIKYDPLMTPEQLKPVVSIKQGNRNDLGYQMEILGRCRIVYQPYNPLNCGAHLWIETYHPVQFVDTQFKPVTARRTYKNV
ncbi:MAG: hypothetical protein WBA93_13045 [Microcoleaceae cyanobacterium]